MPDRRERVADALAAKLHWFKDRERALELADAALAAASRAPEDDLAITRMERDWLLSAWAAATGVDEATAKADMLKWTSKWREVAVERAPVEDTGRPTAQNGEPCDCQTPGDWHRVANDFQQAMFDAQSESAEWKRRALLAEERLDVAEDEVRDALDGRAERVDELRGEKKERWRLEDQLGERSRALSAAEAQIERLTRIGEETEQRLAGEIQRLSDDGCRLADELAGVERHVRWIWDTCRRNLAGQKAASYLGILNFIERNYPDVAKRMAEEERAALAVDET